MSIELYTGSTEEGLCGVCVPLGGGEGSKGEVTLGLILMTSGGCWREEY